MAQRFRILLLSLVLLLGGYSLVHASPLYETYTAYYTDATYSVLCGERWIYCDDVVVWWGCGGPYRIIYYLDSCGGCPPAGC